MADLRLLAPITINFFSKSQFCQNTIENLLHFLKHQDHLHQTTILIVSIFLLWLFLRTQIIISIKAKPIIHFEIQDSPSEALLILIPVSFLFPPALFWKVFIIVAASSPWLDRLSGMVRRSGEWVGHQIGLGLGGPHAGGQEVEGIELGNGHLPPPPAGVVHGHLPPPPAGVVHGHLPPPPAGVVHGVPVEIWVGIPDDQPQNMEDVPI